MQLTRLIAVHMTAAIGAVATGPVTLWAGKGRTQWSLANPRVPLGIVQAGARRRAGRCSK